MDPAIIQKFDLLPQPPHRPTFSYKVMGKHPDGGAYVSFNSDAEAKDAWEALEHKSDRHRLLLSSATEDPMIRILPSDNCQ